MGRNLFDVVLRGFNRRQVNEFLERIEAGEMTASEVRAAKFDVVIRGYDPHQVAETLIEWAEKLDAATEK